MLFLLFFFVKIISSFLSALFLLCNNKNNLYYQKIVINQIIFAPIQKEISSQKMWDTFVHEGLRINIVKHTLLTKDFQ